MLQQSLVILETQQQECQTAVLGQVRKSAIDETCHENNIDCAFKLGHLCFTNGKETEQLIP